MKILLRHGAYDEGVRNIYGSEKKFMIFFS